MKLLQKLFGDKSARDIKEINPILEKARKSYETISSLSNDELRAKTMEFRQKIAEAIADESSQIEEIKLQIESEEDIMEREKLWELVDKHEKESYQITQTVLNDILPEAFNVIKETAKRFKENAEVVVTATDADQELAAKKDSVIIKGDKAHYSNKWMAGGNVITWDMVHYDVQLIGGDGLHEGRIAEMATGEGKTLVATLACLPECTNRQGVHIVTVMIISPKRTLNGWDLFIEFHGLTVDCIDKHQA